MARNIPIVLAADPVGIWEGCYVTDTSKPGTFMEMVPNTNPIGGRFSYRARSAAIGAAGPVCILVNDWEQGQAVTAAMTANQGGHKIYWPHPGEELNALVSETVGSGTSGENLIADRLAINANGLLQAGGAFTSRPFYWLDRSNLGVLATALKWVKFLGSYA